MEVFTCGNLGKRCQPILLQLRNASLQSRFELVISIPHRANTLVGQVHPPPPKSDKHRADKSGEGKSGHTVCVVVCESATTLVLLLFSRLSPFSRVSFSQATSMCVCVCVYVLIVTLLGFGTAITFGFLEPSVRWLRWWNSANSCNGSLKQGAHFPAGSRNTGKSL